MKEGDEYYAVSFDGRVTHEYINYLDTNYHVRAIGIGNAFLTEKEAEKELARRKAKVILERDAKGFKPDWNDDANKYEVYYDYESRSLCVWDYSYACSHRDLWFATREDAEESIKKHEKEWLCYLGVE